MTKIDQSIYTQFYPKVLPSQNSNNSKADFSAVNFQPAKDEFVPQQKQIPKPDFVENIFALFSPSKRLELKKRELFAFSRNECIKQGLSPDKLRILIQKDAMKSCVASVNSNVGGIVTSESYIKNNQMPVLKEAMAHEIKHLQQESLTCSLPENIIIDYNKTALQFLLLKDVDNETKKLLKETPLNEINETFIKKDYSFVENDDDKKNAINEMKGFKLLLENPDIPANELPMSYDYKRFKALRNNRPLSIEEEKKAKSYIESTKNYAKALFDIENNINLNPKQKETANLKAYFSQLTEQEAFDEGFNFSSKEFPAVKARLDEYAELKVKDPILYYMKMWHI